MLRSFALLIALLGSFGDSWIDFAVRVLAIVLSIASTASRAIAKTWPPAVLGPPRGNSREGEHLPN